MMLRASSDIAVAISARSVDVKPRSRASSRPFWRAVTMSISALTGTVISWLATSASFFVRRRPRDGSQFLIEIGEALFEIERGGDALQSEAELNHGERDLGLDADDDRFRAAQANHVSKVAKRANRK